MEIRPIRVRDARTHRLRARAVPEAAVIAAAARTGRIYVQHGGRVANGYGWPARTEAVLAVPVDLHGCRYVAWWAAELPANKVTHGGAAAACLPEARPLFDGRFGAERRSDAKRAVRSLAAAVVRTMARVQARRDETGRA